MNFHPHHRRGDRRGVRQGLVPALPVTLDELTRTAVECEKSGAAVIHVHIRDDDAQPTLDVSRLTDTVAALRAAVTSSCSFRPAVRSPILSSRGWRCSTRGRTVARSPAARSTSAMTCSPTRGASSRTCTSSPWSAASCRSSSYSTSGTSRPCTGCSREFGPPAGGHVHCDLVMGVPGGMPGDVATLVAAVEQLRRGATWSATGIGRTTLPVMFGALAAGGHLRVGMEDTLTFAKGRPVSGNAELVQRAADAAALAQRPPMTPAAGPRVPGHPRLASLPARALAAGLLRLASASMRGSMRRAAWPMPRPRGR